MNEADVLRAIEQGGDAHALLCDADHNLERRFHRACRTLNKLMDDVRQHFPDATYYTASGGLHIILGRSHSHNGRQQQQLEAVGDVTGLVIGDGDY